MTGNVISVYAKGLTTGDIQAHLFEIYGTEVSRETISKITDVIVEDMIAWENRPLDPIYPVLLIDAIMIKVRDAQVANRPVYVAIDETLTVIRLGIPPKLRSTLRSTNAIESIVEICRDHPSNVSGGVTARWRCAGAQPGCSKPPSSSDASRAPERQLDDELDAAEFRCPSLRTLLEGPSGRATRATPVPFQRVRTGQRRGSGFAADDAGVADEPEEGASFDSGASLCLQCRSRRLGDLGGGCGDVDAPVDDGHEVGRVLGLDVPMAPERLGLEAGVDE